MQESDLNNLEQNFRQLNEDLRRLTSSQNKTVPQKDDESDASSKPNTFDDAIESTTAELAETINTIKSGNGQLSHYGSVVDQVRDISNRALSQFGTIGKVASVAVSAFAFLAKRFLGSSDKFIQAHDSLTKHGATIDQLPTQLMEQAHSTRMFFSETLEKYTQSLEILSTSSLYLGKTTGQGFNEFSKLITVSTDVTKLFNALGVEPGTLSKHFAQYIKLQAHSGFEQYKGSEREQNRAIAFTKNLFAMSALTGESVDAMFQRYYELRNDVQFNARMTLLRRQGKEKQAENIEATISMIGSVMGDESAKAYKDIIVNGFSTLDETKGEIVSSGGKIFQMAQRSLEDGAYQATDALKDALTFKREWIKQNEPVLKFGDAEVAKTMGVTAQQYKAVKTYEAGATIEDVIADRKKEKDQASQLKDTQFEQRQMETKAGMMTDKMAQLLSGEAVTAMDYLYSAVKFAAKTFAYGAGLFGKKDLKDEINRLFDTPDEMKKSILKGETELDSITKQLKEKQSKINDQKDELLKFKEMEQRGEITKEQRIQMSKLQMQIYDDEAQLEKLKTSQTQVTKTVEGAKAAVSVTSEAIEGDTQIAKIANVIGKYESDAAGGYRAITRVGDAFKAATSEQRKYMENFLATIETHTIAEVMAFQKWMLKSIAGKNVNTAIGRFQMIPDTLAAIVAKGEKRGEVSRTDKFTPATQNKLLKVLLDDIGYQRFLSGKMTKEQFTARIAGTWAGIAKNELGQGVYDGKHGNRAGKQSFSDMVAALSSSSSPEQSKQGIDPKKPSEPQPPITPLKKFALGGISTDNFAELHGVEAVVPLNNSNTIDVNFEPMIDLNIEGQTSTNMAEIETPEQPNQTQVEDSITQPIQPASQYLNIIKSQIKQILSTMSASTDNLEKALVLTRM